MNNATKLVPVILALILALPTQSAFSSINPELFPVHREYRANVEFWIKIFGEYSETTGVIHDRHNLARIYQVVRLAEKGAPNAREINKKRIDTAKQKIIKTLNHLANGHSPANHQERSIARLFGKNAHPADFQQAAQNLRVQSGMKNRFAQGIVRSGRYHNRMQKIFRHYGLPTELTYLPHVESSFNLKAYSKAGAAGVWQFTRGTGKRYLRIGESVDERRDPILATHAAAKLLMKNYHELASWPLAITAYNHGLAGMRRAKSQHGSYPEIFKNYQSRSFKFASKNFYSEFIAAYLVAKNYVGYFGNLRAEPPEQFHTLTLPGYLSLNTLTERLGISRTAIAQYNPAFRQPIFNGRKHIPKGYSLRFPISMQPSRISYLLPEQFYSAQQKPNLYHTVKKGETALGIARRHGVRLRDLVLANNLNGKATIYPEQKLSIPGKVQKTAGLVLADPENKTRTGIQPQENTLAQSTPVKNSGSL